MNYLTNLWNALDFGAMKDLLLRLVSVFLCLTVHETCHGLAAYALGDPTAKRQHRLSLNPLRHIDWFGLAAMVLVGFGWAKPVPVNPNYFKNPKRGMALTALAGPLSNMLLALAALLAVRLLWASAIGDGVLLFLLETALLSIGLGSKVLFALLPENAYRFVLRYERYGMILLWVLVLTDIGGDRLSNAIYSVFTFFCQIIGI